MAQDERVLANILEIFRLNPSHKFNVDELEHQARRKHMANFTQLIRSLSYLEQHKQIITDGQGNYQLASVDKEVEGDFRANDKGFGFVRLDDEDADDIFIGRDNTKFAVDGDRVKVRVIANGNTWNGKGPEGKVIAILERGAQEIVGEFLPFSDVQVTKTGFLGYVTSQNKKLSKYRVLVSKAGLTPQMHDMVKVSIKDFPSADHPETMTGAVVLVIGNKNDPGVDIMSIVADHDIRTDWPDDAMAQANAIPDHVTAAEKQSRMDITDQPAVTIDGDDSKDFDDAVVCWRLPNGNYHLGVHIADVSHYVHENSPLDKEAFARGNSTYLVDRVIPMLPFRLSNGICSLNEGVDRLVLSCDMEISPAGKRLNYSIHPSVMRSHGRLTYNKVNQTLAGHLDGLEGKYRKLAPMLQQMAQLHEVLYKQRHARGAIDFEEPEAQIIVDDQGKPVDIVLHNRGTAEKMVESFMLMANETVAEDYFKKQLPFLYRVHETPDGEKMTDFFSFIQALGVDTHADPNHVKPLDLQRIVTKTEGTPEEAVIQMVMLRSLKQAHYYEQPLGHFGLAAKFYTHFTSPIRRYSDLMVHRMIHAYHDESTGEKVQNHFKKVLPEVAVQTSTQERRSVDTERSVDDLKMTEFMADKVGQHFDAVVSSVTSFGMFIQLPNTVEGLIHISNLNDDYYAFNERSLTLTGRGTHRTFKIGMPIKVTLINANVEQHQLDFELYDPKAKKKKPHFENRGNYHYQRRGHGARNSRNNHRGNQRRRQHRNRQRG